MENERKDIRTPAKKYDKLQTLMCYVNKETLMEQHKKQMKGKASGIDGITKEQYKELDSIKNKVHYVKCSICGKEFRAKGKRKYCSDDCKKVAFRQQNNTYFRNMSEEQRAKRREASRLSMRKYRQNKEKENK